jgi:hypothetical protein
LRNQGRSDETLVAIVSQAIHAGCAVVIAVDGVSGIGSAAGGANYTVGAQIGQ